MKHSILFLNRRFEMGGAERQIVALAKGLREAGWSVSAAPFYPGGLLEKHLAAADVPLLPLRKRSRWDVLGFLWHLISLVKELKPDVLHGYLGTANILSVILKPLFPSTRMVWGVRASNVELRHYGWLQAVQFWVECRLSRFADLIIVNSNAGYDYAAGHGFPPGKMIVVHNGVDVEQFHPDPEARIRLRREWGIAPGEVLIGLIARLDPMKGHESFLRAAALLGTERHHVRFVCVGSGSLKFKQKLRELCEQLDLGKRVMWIDSCDDITEIYNALDIAMSSSDFGEGFPNVVGEAMACGVPCVVTDIGDSALIVGATGEVVPCKNPAELAGGCNRLLERLQREPDLGARARARIVQHFGVDRLVGRTESALKRLQQENAVGTRA